MILVDTSVLVDVTTDDPRWGEWSSDALAGALDRDQVVANPMVFAEFSLAFLNERDAESTLDQLRVQRLDLPWRAAFLAGKAFALYRSRGGHKGQPLPDFFIGAHAAVAGMTLLTRDPRRVKQYFPKVRLIAPERA